MEEILEFIKRRFPTDCHWVDGNCFYLKGENTRHFSGEMNRHLENIHMW